MPVRYLFFILVSSLLACNTSQKTCHYDGAPQTSYSSNVSSYPPHAKPGTCNSRCVIPSPVNIKADTVLVLDIEQEVPEEYISYDLVLKLEKEWVKKKTDNCLSSDPEDCYVLCLTSVPTKVSRVYSKVVNQTIGSSVKKIIIQEQLDYETNEVDIEWREVVCEASEIKYQEDLEAGLRGLGYEIDSDNRASFKKALLTYQLQNRLPIGNLDVETVQSLGIKI